MTNGNEINRAARIAAARAELARRQAEDPEGVARYEARRARLTAAAKRERERVEHLVLGGERPKTAPTTSKKRGRRKIVAKAQPVSLAAGIEERVVLRERWSHKAQGTPETHEHASRTHQGAIAQLYANGTIDAEQLEWVAEIANVYRSLEADVAVKVASLEARVDQSRQGGQVPEGIRRVRMHLAYGYWRDLLPAPKALVLDMIVGDAIGYTLAAKRYGIHNRKAKRLLLEAIDRWPECMRRAYRQCSPSDLAEGGKQKQK